MRDKATRVTPSADGAVLVMRGGALGDFVLTLPVLAEVARRHRRPPVLCASSAHVELARSCGPLERALRIDDPRWGALFAGGDLTPLGPLLAGVESAYVLRPVDPGAIRRRLARCGVRRVSVLDPRPPADGSRHAADHLWSVLGPAAGPVRPRIALDRGRLSRGRRELRASVGDGDGPVAVLAPGAGNDVKRWPLDSFRALAAELRAEGIAVAWMLGPVERDRRPEGWDGMRPRLEDDGPATAAAQLAAASVVVGNDTGTSHLAAAAGASVVACFGPTDHRTWAPRGVSVDILRAPGHGPRCEVCPVPCERLHPAPCLTAITPARVAAAVTGPRSKAVSVARGDISRL